MFLDIVQENIYIYTQDQFSVYLLYKSSNLKRQMIYIGK